MATVAFAFPSSSASSSAAAAVACVAPDARQLNTFKAASNFCTMQSVVKRLCHCVAEKALASPSPALAVGSSSLTFTSALAHSGHGMPLPQSRGVPRVQFPSNGCLIRPSFLAGGSLFMSRPREQLQKEGRRAHNRKRTLRAALSQSVDAYRRVGAPNVENVNITKLMECLEEAGAKGREVIMAAVDKPRTIDYKGATDLVTDTDRNTEEAILAVVRKYFPDHLILGEEGGVSGDPSSEYLWCVDPLDGTTNFAQNYPSFAVSIAVLYKGRPVAATVVEFAGGPFIWDTRTYTASSGGGAFCNGRKINCSQRDQVERSLFVTGFGYEHDEAWATNIDLFKEFTDKSRGVRRLGAAAVDMSHVALGIVEAYWEYRLKPWDMAAGVLIVEEAGGKVTAMDGSDFSVFDRSVLVSNGILHDKLLERIAPPTKKLIEDGLDFSQWYKPEGYISEE